MSRGRYTSGPNSRSFKHGMCDTPTYSSWKHMLRRVRGQGGPKSKRDYQDRGISVCRRWLKFENFFSDMGVRLVGRTLDRKNNDGNYTKKNCKWSTKSEQEKNKRERAPRCSTGVKGVYIYPRATRKPYVAIAYVDGKQYYAGYHATVEEAVIAQQRKLRR